jgi:hypothetical protein
MLRPLQGVERPFVLPDAIEFMQLAVKFATPSVISRVLPTFQKLFKIGLHTKIIDNAYHSRAAAPPVIPIPSWITDCQHACQWFYDHHTLPISDGLCTIGANADLIVVNASHNVADGGFLHHALTHCFRDPPAISATSPELMTETYRPEIEKSLELAPALLPYGDCTSFAVDPRDPHLAPADTPAVFWHFRLQAPELACFSKKLNRPKGLAEALWIAKSMAVGTRGGSVARLAIPIVVDLRRYVDRKRISAACVNHVGAVCCAVDTSPTMKLTEVARGFRQNLARYEKCLAPFYSVTRDEYFPGKPNRCYPHSSFMGAVEIKHPVKDFYIATNNSGFGIDRQILMFAFARVTGTRNELCVQARFSPRSVTMKDAHIVVESVKHFLKTIPLEATVGDAHRELQAFQAQLDKEY